MSVTIEFIPELEAQLHKEAALLGLNTDEYAAKTLRDHLRQKRFSPSIPEAEARLLHTINQGLTTGDWQHYQDLVAKRKAETLTQQEQDQLVVLSDQLETGNARRMESLTKLAQLRHITLSTLMQQLGIQTPSYG